MQNVAVSYSKEPLTTVLYAREEKPEQKAAREAAEAEAARKAAEEEEARKAAEEEERKKRGSPTDAEAKLLREVMEKKEAIKARDAKIAELEKKVAEWDGLDLAELKKLQKEKKEQEEKRLAEQGQWEALKKQMNDAHATELAREVGKRDEQIIALQGEKTTLTQQIAELTVGNAFGNSKFIAEEMALTPAKARVLYGSHFEHQDGKIVAFDKPAGAKGRTMLVGGRGEPLGFEEAIQRIVDADPERDSVLRSKAKPGAGSSTRAHPGAKPEDEVELTGRSRIAAGLAAAAKARGGR